MRLVAVTLVYFVCLCQTDDGRAPLRILGKLGQTVTLPCHDKSASVTPALTQWLKDGKIVARRNHSSQLSPTLGHFIILNNGSLDIVGLLPIDEGLYECQCTPRNRSNVHNHTVVHLEISNDGKSPLRILGKQGHTVTLPCHDKSASVTPALTQWLKDGNTVATRDHSSQLSPTLGHFIILNNGSLDIVGLLPIDEGLYECQCTPRNRSNVHSHTWVHLQILNDGRILGELGQTVTLPCHDKTASVTPALTQWLKDGNTVATRNHSSQLSPTPGHFIILNNGSLDIVGLLKIDEGLYECQCTPRNPSNVHSHTEVHLQIFSGLQNVTLDISPVEKLPNGTLYVRNGTDVHFKCSSNSTSYPSRTLSWILEGVDSEKVPRVSGSGSLIQFEVLSITPSNQGNHICLAENTVSKKRVINSTQLLVYFPPERHPECNWRIQNYSFLAVFICSWHGGYPEPSLQWEDMTSGGAVLGSAVSETLEVTLNRSQLSDGQELKCGGKHIAASEKRSCHLTLKMPFPEGEPLVVAIEGTNVTLTCTDAQSIPPAKTIWQRTVAHKNIEHGSKYVISDQGPTFSLTIVNLTKDDEGTYFCRSENPIAARELEIYLTVKSSVSYAGGIVGTFLSVIILGVGIAIGMAAYNNRHKICLGYPFSFLSEERNDVLNLVESDDEEIFQDAVPRLPVLPNGHSTTLVEIHRIPSSDHEEQDNTERSQANQDPLTETA